MLEVLKGLHGTTKTHPVHKVKRHFIKTIKTMGFFNEKITIRKCFCKDYFTTVYYKTNFLGGAKGNERCYSAFARSFVIMYYKKKTALREK